MADLELQHRVRIALSWRAEARRLIQEAQTRFASGELEEGRFRHLQQKLADELNTAQRAIDTLRQREGNTAARLGGHLAECLQRKSAIAQQVKDGSIAHATATAEIARLDEEIKAMRESIGEFNRLLAVEDVNAVGGHLALRLVDYPIRLSGADKFVQPLAEDGPRFQRFQLNRSQTVWALIGAAIVLLGFFAIWFITKQNRSIEMVAHWDASTPAVVVGCANHGAHDFMLYVPQPAAGTKPIREAYSLQALAPGPLDTTGAWTVEGRATQYSNPQRIGAGRHVDYVLHLDRLPPGPLPDTLEIQCLSPSGRVVNRVQVSAPAAQ